jgi:hypothetical protein
MALPPPRSCGRRPLERVMVKKLTKPLMMKKSSTP